MSVMPISNVNFEKEVISSEKTVLLDFYADWCGPCRMVGPIVSEISDERSDIKVCKINVDNEAELASRFQITSIPTLIVIKNGSVANKSVGYISKGQILSML